MAHTNATENYGLPQWIGTDKPTFLGDFNSAFGTIDTQLKANADASTSAVATANQADQNATTASQNASNAVGTANTAKGTADDAIILANQAKQQSTTAANDASTALRASAANTITNLAPAYDATRTYAVGDLVTYIDAQNSGKLYRCIVTVSSPMEFNINYWDDVTASEAFSTKMRLVATITTDGVKTRAEVLESLIENANFGVNKRFLLKLKQGDSTIIYNSAINGTDYTAFSYVQATPSALYVDYYTLQANACVVRETAITSESTTINNLSDTIQTAGLIYELYEIE